MDPVDLMGPMDPMGLLVLLCVVWGQMAPMGPMDPMALLVPTDPTDPTDPTETRRRFEGRESEAQATGAIRREEHDDRDRVADDAEVRTLCELWERDGARRRASLRRRGETRKRGNEETKVDRVCVNNQANLASVCVFVGSSRETPARSPQRSSARSPFAAETGTLCRSPPSLFAHFSQIGHTPYANATALSTVAIAAQSVQRNALRHAAPNRARSRAQPIQR